MTTDNLIEQINNISLNKSEFYVENTYNPDKKFFITKVNLNFYQLWAMFGQIPFIHTKGKCKYEWIIRQSNSDRIFSIFDWNNKNKLMDTTQWYIRSNMPDDCSDFLETLTDAIECYNLYYKNQIENDSFDYSLDPDAYEIKNNFKKYIDLLQTL